MFQNELESFTEKLSEMVARPYLRTYALAFYFFELYCS